MTPTAPAGRLTRRGLLSGAVAGAASALAFTAVHDLLISDIWATLPLMLGAGAACGLSLGWTYHRLVTRPTLGSWVRYNLLFVALFVGLGAVSVWVFEPVTTMAEVLAANAPPTALFRQALPMTAAFTLGMAGLVHLRYGHGPRQFTAILGTCVLLVLLLGLNVSAIGLVAIPRGASHLIAEMFALIAMLGAVYAAVFVGLERRRFWGPLVILLAVAAGGPASAQPAGAQRAALPSTPVQTGSEAERIEELMARYHALGRFHGAVLVARDGAVLYEGGAGVADATWGVPNAPDVAFDIGSVTKMFTAVLVMQQAERGALRLDAPAAAYLPDVPVPLDGRITLDHLLTHRSGLPDFANDLEDADWAPYLHRRQPADSVVAAMLRRPLEFAPGAGYDYSNTGYVVLGLVLEAVTGRPYCDLLRDEVLAPAGMEASGCSRFEAVVPRRATGYRREAGALVHAPYWHSSYADGEMVSTVRDLFRFDAAMRSGRLLSAEAQAAMTTPRVADDWIGDDYGPGLRHFYGYGVEVHRRPGADADSVTVVGHGGGGGGYTAMVWRVPEDGVLIAVANVEVPPLYPELFDILYGRPYRLPTAPEGP